ncbi:hypothetical protein ACSBL2_24895 [Pedobacter sp. AW31-3R]|uniref:hypothetical protein n=1 Tax=Pedobacter sp. AW31-3R TaxID=3445781 RepID=UPI003FA07686
MKFETILNDYYIDPKYLSIYRIIYCFIVLFLIGLPSYSWIAGSLDYLFNPPVLSFSALFSHFPAGWFFITLTLLNLCFFMLMFLGVASRWTSLLFSITCIIGHNFWYSFGKIDHLLLWYLAPAFLGFAGWGKYFSLNLFTQKHTSYKISSNTNAMIILIFALAIGFSMFTSAAEKMIGGWLSWKGEGVRFHFLRIYNTIDRNDFLTPILQSFDNHIFWKMMDYSALILEFGFIFSVIRIKYFRFFIAAGVVFHMLVLLMFNIPFYSNLIVYLIFIDWNLLTTKWNLESVFIKNKKERTIVNIMGITATFFTIYWLVILCKNIHFFTFPGLLESMLRGFSIPNSFEVSLTVFFLIIFLFAIYMAIRHFNAYIKLHNNKPKIR